MAAKNTALILQRIRELMKTCYVSSQSIQAYIIPSEDAHMSEYVAACDKRRACVSGFTGSSGTAIVTEDKAALWTDGRYYLQAQHEMDSNWTLMKDGLPDTLSQGDWLCKMLAPSSKVGIDPKLMSLGTWKSLKDTLASDGHQLVPVLQNLVDLVWTDRPNRPCNPLTVLSTHYTGLTWQEKIEIVRNKMKNKNVTALVISALDEIAWLFNLRGSDIEYNPVFFAYAVITFDKTLLFLDSIYLTDEIRQHLLPNSTSNDLLYHPYDDIITVLTNMVPEQSGKIWMSDKSNYALYSAFPESRVVNFPSPVAVLKAVKHECELTGMKNAHVKDAIALCEYFAWLEKEVPKGTVTEISGADYLDLLRQQQAEYVGPSFATISASGANGAIIHYKPTPQTDRPITMSDLYLCDSGAQFKDGTTDVTRTMHFGTPSEYEKECFTLVLKGHINLARVIFPNGVKGSRLECIARQPLWVKGLDYAHGTGHGVGAFLNVHEGPCMISPRTRADEVALEAGMILSDEPGYYENEKFGIRIESLVQVVKVDTAYNFQNVGFLSFQPLTLVPIQSKMIKVELLTADELAWLNNYHNTCRQIIGAALKSQGREEIFQWLMRETEPIVQ